MINRVIIVGRLTKTPEVRTTPNGISVCSFSLAFDNKTRNSDGSRTASFINCTAWRQNAEFIGKYCEKGTQVGIEGSLQERRYQRRDGSNASVVEIIVDTVTLFGSRNNNSNVNNSAQNDFAANAPQGDSTFDDDLMDDVDGDLADDDLPF